MTVVHVGPSTTVRQRSCHTYAPASYVTTKKAMAVNSPGGRIRVVPSYACLDSAMQFIFYVFVSHWR